MSTQYPFFTETCSVERKTVLATDNYGKSIIEWETIILDIPCRLFQPQFAQSSSVREVIQPTEAEVIRNYTLLVPPDTDATELDRIRHSNGKLYEIRGVIDPGGFQHHLELSVQVIE